MFFVLYKSRSQPIVITVRSCDWIRMYFCSLRKPFFRLPRIQQDLMKTRNCCLCRRDQRYHCSKRRSITHFQRRTRRQYLPDWNHRTQCCRHQLDRRERRREVERSQTQTRFRFTHCRFPLHRMLAACCCSRWDELWLYVCFTAWSSWEDVFEVKLTRLFIF